MSKSKTLAKIFALVAACLLLGIVAISAQGDDAAPREEASWCRAPVRIPLAVQDVDGVEPTDGVVIARGAEAVMTDSGPAIRLPDAGSRVQVTLPEPLFHTEWLFARVNRLDTVRVDASLNDVTRRLDAVTVLGSLEIAEEGRTLVTSGRLGGYQRARIDVHTGVDQVLLSNDGASAVDLLGVIGCPAFVLHASVEQAPTWDADRQRFVARHRVVVTNNLRNASARALKNQRPASPDTIIDNFQVELDVRAPGFSSAEVTEWEVPEFYEGVVSDAFDGSAQTELFDGRQPLRDGKPQTFEFVVEYEPDFDDPAWSEGVGSPNPELRVRGSVDDVTVGLTAVLANSGAQIDTATGGAAGFGAPTPTLDVDHRWVEEPNLASDGTVRLRERISVTNDGETALAELSIIRDLEELFGEGTNVSVISAEADGPCAGGIDDRYTGVGRRVRLLASPNSMSVGSTCVVEIELIVWPGIAPTAEGVDYRGPIEVTARSGVRSATDFALAGLTLSQNPSIASEVRPPTIVNVGDGSYRISGTATITNDGDQNLRNGLLRIDVGDGSTTEPRRVFAQEFRALSTTCAGAETPSRSRSSLVLASRLDLEPGDRCAIRYDVSVRPGAAIADWTITPIVSAVAPRGEELIETGDPIEFDLPESPEIEVAVRHEPTRNFGNGVHAVDLEFVVTNAGDVPLTSVFVDNDIAGTFGDGVQSVRAGADTCGRVSPRQPLLPSGANGEAGSCRVAFTVEVAPAAQLEDWNVSASAVASSTSTVVVDATGASDPITFVENPELVSDLRVLGIDTLDDGQLRFRLTGRIENTGDVNVGSLSAVLDLQAAFDGRPIVVEGLSSDDFVIAPTWTAGSASFLEASDILRVGASGDWFATVVVDVAGEPGPWRLETTATGIPPTLEPVESTPAAVSRSIPMFSVADETLTSENNGDGTYTVRHRLVLQNRGVAAVDQIAVVDDFDSVFGGVLVSEPRRGGSCGTGLGVDDTCVVSVIGRIRPAAQLGPWAVTAAPSAQDRFGVVAVELAPVVESGSVQAFSSLGVPEVLLEESPSIAVAANRSDIVNNGDGTYTVDHGVIVRNDGDVPLYEVRLNDAIGSTFGERIVDLTITSDGCSEVGFVAPLGPGSTCELRTSTIVRPLSELGPWATTFVADATSPAGAIVTSSATPDDVNFSETVAAIAESSLVVDGNRGNGLYDATFSMSVENTSDVPLVGLEIDDGLTSQFGDRLVEQALLLDECALITSAEPLAPGGVCRVERSLVVRPVDALGPWTVPTTITAPSPSGKIASVEIETPPVSFEEAPAVSVSSEIELVENMGDGSFRVVLDLTVVNEGDVRLDDLDVALDANALFGDVEHRVDGLLSESFEVSEQFTTRESISMLTPGQSIVAGGVGELTVVFTVRPDGEVEPFMAPIDVIAVSPAQAITEASKQTTIDLPSVSLSVLEQSVTNNRDGSYTIETQYSIRNSGTTDLENIRLGEDIFAIFQGAPAGTTEIRSSTIDVLAPDEPDRRGEIVRWGQTLAVGAAAEIVTVTEVEPGNSLGPFEWGAEASAVSPTGTPVGVVTTASQPVVFVEQPDLVVEQRLTRRPEWSPSGRFDVSLAVDVTNAGDIELRSLQVREDLLSAFGWQSTIIVRDIRSDTLTVNENYDGLGIPPRPDVELDADGEPIPYEPPRPAGDVSLLAGWDTLPAGETATIELDLTLAPETRGVYHTRVNVSARTPGGVGLGSGGDDGEVIEATTLARLSVQGELGVAKQVIGEPSVRADGSVAVTYEILVQNAGPFPLTDVEVHDQLAQAFGLGSTFVTSRVRTEADSPCTGKASSSYDGGAIDPVLVSGVELRPEEQCRIQYDAFVLPSKAFPGPYRSSAFAVGADPFSGTVIDDSTDGADPDPDQNQEPGDNDLATSVTVENPTPQLEIVAVPIDVVEAARDDWFDVTWQITLTNAGDINATQTRVVADLDDAWSVPFTVRDLSSDELSVNTSFDGSRDVRLLRASNVLRVGESAELTFVVSSPAPRGDALEFPVEFEARSIAGRLDIAPSALVSATASVELASRTGQTSLNPFAGATTEEQRLLILGTAVFVLFALLGLWTGWRRYRTWRDVRRSSRPRRDPNEVVIDLRDGVVDVTDQPSPRRLRRGADHGERRRRRGSRDRDDQPVS